MTSSNITQINVDIHTGKQDNAGTDAYIYLGIAGREFCLDTGGNDFEAGSQKVFKLGKESNILNKENNDPRKPQLTTDYLTTSLSASPALPAYIRMVPHGSKPGWNLSFVKVSVNPGSESELNLLAHPPLGNPEATVPVIGSLWLGEDCGLYCYLICVKKKK
jgi:hypothetical protein